MRSLSALLALAFVSVPVALTACAGDEDENASTTSDEVSKGGGAACNVFVPSTCKKGLICARDGLADEGKRKPGGAIGMPSPIGKCRKPTSGELGGPCNPKDGCSDDLVCGPKGTCEVAPEDDAGSE